ncbi:MULTISPECIES: HlyD family efflux transporter periplasmic adaptor subunit [Leclercia]|jgi:adhesin transport system membrane fusion protein|uniref:Hemolysin secretion protein D n=1 Tax=Leclercia adecarboxylata TaxID=83655 RepID=A0A855EQL9_9ENTR|nr:HlyD family efflux transporter periplasmic adaptor subunit [Leclercia adecarboxylata]KFC89995.1 HlyD family secretion protein [Leclercia adecarboxylata ATCC 23216 = NBRC 102595]MBK0351953.1 HlyD family efflux transporter periplasmic adaptor subunit [Leclercia adecarboxylata]MCE9984931.1 HlyD family efflux transporter periplasmic adaptor subunit [Leclercia adecarboxylata]MCU6675435.1 HlyD family efflux transporter periplasmic adaptor subunit [Leclercia adecarboxylata]MCV3302185.1 HlyD family
MAVELFDDEVADAARVHRLENYHRSRISAGLIWSSVALVLGFVIWASYFRIDEVARAHGEVIASSRVQIIQTVDGGVLSELHVKEGDHVKAGQILARLDPTRVEAAAGEVDARIIGLRARIARLRAESTGQSAPRFPSDPDPALREQADIERALFLQRRQSLQEDITALQTAVNLASQKLNLVNELERSGDVSTSERLNAQRDLNEARARLLGRRNKFLDDARADLTKAEDDLGQTLQQMAGRRQQVHDTVFTAMGPGIVKNVRVTTLGGVLRAGDEIMQIVPSDDALIIEAKVLPADIARVQVGLPATVRLDPFDYTIYGALQGEVIYVSADTLKENTPRGEEIYYRVHVRLKSHAEGQSDRQEEGQFVRSTTGRQLDILPGMTSQLDIRTGDRTLMDFLLKPLRKTLSESFQER